MKISSIFALEHSTQKILNHARTGWGISSPEERQKIAQRIDALYGNRKLYFSYAVLGVGVSCMGFGSGSGRRDVFIIGCLGAFLGYSLYHVSLRQLSEILIKQLSCQRWGYHYPKFFGKGSFQRAVLRVTAEDDYNGGFKPNFGESEVLRKLSKSYTVYEMRVSSIPDINEAIEWVRLKKKTIQLLWLRAHGSSKGMAFSKKRTQGVSLSQIDYSKLAPDAAIWLQSCSTGASPRPFCLSPAEHVKLAAGPDRRVFAPNEITGCDALELVDPETREIKFYKRRAKTTKELMYGNFDREKLITAEPTFKGAQKKIRALTTKSKPIGSSCGQRLSRFVRKIAQALCGRRVRS